MKKQALRRFTVLSFLLMIVSALALLCPGPPSRVTAQEANSKGDSAEARSEKRAHRRYILKDLGTLGGPASQLSFFAKILNNRGTVVGNADTSTPDPFAPNCLSPSCFVSHGFKWEHGIKTDLGTLPGGSSSDASSLALTLARESVQGGTSAR